MSRGYSLIELVIASAIMLTVSGAVLGLVHDGLAGTPILEETTDLHQRARVVADAVAADLRAAAAGTPSGSLSRHFAAVEPRRPGDPPGTSTGLAITLRYAVSGGAHSRLVQPLDPGVPIAIVDAVNGCPAGTAACGFVADTTALVFDSAGHADLVSIDSVGPGVLSITDVSGGRAASYAAATEIAEATQVSYLFDPAAATLRREEGGGSFVVADNVIGVAFEYLDAAMAPMPLPGFSDGPFAGAGPTAFDLDLLRVRTVRATLRLQTGVDNMRGTDPRFFARPGTATGPRVIPDLVSQIEVALRNGGS